MKHLILTGLIFLCVPSWGNAESAGDKMELLMEENWREISKTAPPFLPPEKAEMWNYRVTIPFPRFWPPRSGELIYYAFSYGIDISRLSNGEYVGGLWARIFLKGDDSLKLELLATKIAPLGVQGVVPLGPKEKEVYDSGELVTASLSQLNGAPEEGNRQTIQLRNYFCLWIRNNKILADQISPYHQDFFNWLACPK